MRQESDGPSGPHFLEWLNVCAFPDRGRPHQLRGEGGRPGPTRSRGGSALFRRPTVVTHRRPWCRAPASRSPWNASPLCTRSWQRLHPRFTTIEQVLAGPLVKGFSFSLPPSKLGLRHGERAAETLYYIGGNHSKIGTATSIGPSSC
jgi:hypothetical protein